jgi:hypothetical protein
MCVATPSYQIQRCCLLKKAGWVGQFDCRRVVDVSFSGDFAAPARPIYHSPGCRPGGTIRGGDLENDKPALALVALPPRPLGVWILEPGGLGTE